MRLVLRSGCRMVAVLQGDVLSMETGMYTLKWDAYSGGGYGEGGGGWYFVAGSCLPHF
ncbi:hypothetical protein IG631_06256 [Alternaria alternata]|jgi:hypothetical protein|nr:hypothetical protein IG631_06256 [Alternaria alternata]